MNKDTSIWMPIYIGDLQSKFARMSPEQIGATFLLMMDFWKNGPIPNQNAILASITKLPQSKVKLLTQTITDLGVFESTTDHLKSDYLSVLKEQATLNQKMKSDKAKQAAQARWGKSSSHAQALLEHVQQDAQVLQKHTPQDAKILLEQNSGSALAKPELYPSPSPSPAPSPSPSPSPAEGDGWT
ncbi:hypothetical protein, partial [Acinetobacter defluvii]|uniref:hypothetical protein n=1 Tax=Acinetobacter defluvii TaxID=1871111 RepID=UPI003AF879B9